jgi:hypothetical protein
MTATVKRLGEVPYNPPVIHMMENQMTIQKASKPNNSFKSLEKWGASISSLFVTSPDFRQGDKETAAYSDNKREKNKGGNCPVVNHCGSAMSLLSSSIAIARFGRRTSCPRAVAVTEFSKRAARKILIVILR